MEQDRFTRQQKAIIAVLQLHPTGFTRLQLARATGIERASICRRVAELRDGGRICVHHEALDPLTNTKTEFLAIKPLQI